MTFYGNLAGTVLRLVGKYGRPVTLQFATDASPPDAAKPWNPGAPSLATFSGALAVVTPVEEEYVDHSIILQTDEQAIMAASGMPAVPDNKTLFFDGPSAAAGATQYKVTKVTSVGPGSVPLAYILFLRR